MLLIRCPFCGPRDEREFDYGGPVALRRPENPELLTDREWVEYLTSPDNPVGPVRERWWHARGCGAWVEICRDTVTHAVADNGTGEP